MRYSFDIPEVSHVLLGCSLDIPHVFLTCSTAKQSRAVLNIVEHFLKNKRASRSLAKTGLFGGSKSVAGAVFSSLSRKDRILDVLKT